MKKLVLLSAALLITGSAMAASTYTQAFKPGQYEGSFKSVVPAMNGSKCTADVKNAADNVEATINCADGTKEVWSWNDKTLLQKEIDAKAGTVTNNYSASAIKAAPTNEQVFAANGDKANNKCEGGTDCRTTWTVRSTANGFDYVVYGPQDKANAASPIVERHVISFKSAK